MNIIILGIIGSSILLHGIDAFVSKSHSVSLNTILMSNESDMAGNDQSLPASQGTEKMESTESIRIDAFSKEPSSQQQKPVPTPELFMKAMNTSPRRIVLSTITSSAIALTANFCGVTSNILSAVPESTVEKSGLDSFYPRGDMKRFKSGEFQYTFVVPKEWVQDTAVELAKIQRKAGNLDYSMRKNANAPIPDVAYGPPGYFNDKGISQSDTNISTLVSPVRPGFTLKSLGSPTQAAETLLRVSLAPPGSGKVATLLATSEEVRGASNLYQFEYRVDRGDKGLPLQAISIIAVRDGDALVTMTVVALEREWEDKEFEGKLRKIAGSFKLTK